MAGFCLCVVVCAIISLHTTKGVPMTPAEMLETFSTTTLRKAREMRQRTDTPVVPDGPLELYPQAWCVRGTEDVYKVHLVCEPGLEGTTEHDIFGASCTCPNGKNSPLGKPRCYHVAAILMELAGYLW